MEIEDKQNNATEISRRTRQSHLDSHLDLSSPPNSPPRSSISSDLSSLSHGIISPTRDEAPVVDSPPHRVSSAAATVNRYVVEEPVPIKKTDRGAQDGFVSIEEGQERKRGVEGPAGGGRRLAAATVRRTEREAVAKKAAFGFRIFELLFCLVSLSVMATDKNKGWAIDSFHRYKEFRSVQFVRAFFLLSGGSFVNVLKCEGMCVNFLQVLYVSECDRVCVLRGTGMQFGLPIGHR